MTAALLRKIRQNSESRRGWLSSSSEVTGRL
jgi:hypothetical protein